jgi:pimeloyl-ACP methyl ester carboxylesterase
MRVRSTNGVTIAAHDLGGPESGVPVLIAHATGFCGRAYEPLAKALSDRFRVWAIDFRGHGDSTEPTDGDYAWTGMAEDLLAVTDAVGIERWFGFGHSLGGGVLLLAEMARPGLLRSTYLFEPIVLPSEAQDLPAQSPLPAIARGRREVFPSRPEALARYAGRPPLNVLRADSLAAYVEHGFADQPDGTVRLKCSGESEARTFEAESKLTVDRVAGIEVPTTVAIGLRGEGPNPARFAPAIVETMPRAWLLEYAHLDHFGPFQDPETIAEDAAAAYS